MKKSLSAIALFIVAVTPAWAQAPNLDAMDIVLKSIHDGPIAKVNGVNIPKEEFVDLYRSELTARKRMQGGAEVSDADRVRLGIHILGRVVQQEILLQEADKRGITPNEDRVEQVYRQTLSGFRQASRNRNMSEDEVLKLIGATKEEALREIREGVRIEKVREAIAEERGVSISQQEVFEELGANRDRFVQPEQVHIKQIYFRIPRVPGDARTAERQNALERAQTAHKLIMQGQRFETVARQHTDGPPQLKETGGDMGLMPVSELPPPIVQSIQNLDPGDISNIIETDFGYHIVKLVDTVKGGAAPDEERITEVIRADLMAERSEKAVRQWVQEVMENRTYDVVDYLNLEQQLRFRPDVVRELQASQTPGED